MSFDQRLDLLKNSIENILIEFYPDHQEMKHRFFEVLSNNYQERKEDLKHTDVSDHFHVPNLLSENHVAMMLYVDHFCSKIKELKKHISYFESLGITIIHLMPILESPPLASDGGYSVSNYRQINPALGNMEELEEFIELCREKNISVLLDFVINHCSDQHEWAIKAKDGDPFYRDFFHVFSDNEFPSYFDANFTEVFPESAPGNFTYVPQINAKVMTIFHNYQWDLNYDNPEVLLRMIDNVLFLANRGVQYFRLDAVAFLGKNPDNSKDNQRFIHRILQLFKLATSVVCPSVYLVAEAIDHPKNIVPYFGSETKKECDLAYHATLMYLIWDALAHENTQLMCQGLLKLPQKPSHATWINYARCHDEIGFLYDRDVLVDLEINIQSRVKHVMKYYTQNGSFSNGVAYMVKPGTDEARISGTLASLCGLERAIEENNLPEIKLAIQKICMIQSIVLTFGGIPLIYSGDEYGQLNDLKFQDDPSKSYDNRWLHRPKFKFEKRTEIENEIYSKLVNMINIRKKNPIFNDSITSELILLNDELFVFKRKLNDEIMILIHSFSSKTTFFKNPLHDIGQWYDLIINKKVYQNIKVDAFEHKWLILKN
jgi:amylosucrase